MQKRICSDRNDDWVDRLDYQVDVCEHFTHSSENGSIVAALSDCHNGKFVSGFLSSSQLSFDIANTGLETKSNEKGHVRLDLVSSLPETKSSLIDPSLFNEMDDASPKRSATVLYCGAHIIMAGRTTFCGIDTSFTKEGGI